MACACHRPLGPSCHAGAMSAADHVLLPRELAPTCSISERNGVVPGAPRRRSGVIARIGRHVGLWREAAAILAATITRAQELDRIGNDIDGLSLVALLVLPLAPLEPSVDRDGPPL